MKELVLTPSRNAVVTDEGIDFLERERYEQLRKELGGMLPVMGGAKIHPDEGLTYMLNALLRRTPTPTTDPLYLGLFTSQTNATVPARTAVLATATGVTEASGGGYARPSIGAASWPAPASVGAGMRTTVASPGVSFAESTGAYSAAINGFFLATAVTAGVAIFYSNSETVEGTPDAALTVNAAGFVVRIAPFQHLNN